MMKRLTAMVLALCVFAGVFFHAPAAKADSYTAYVISNTMRVYKSASTSSKLLGTLPFGVNLTCTAVSGNWAKVRNSSGTVGYCALSSLSASNPNTLNVIASINKSDTPIYKVPSTSAAVWLKLKKGVSLTAVAMTRDNTWVRLKNGKYYGYVQAKYLTIASASTTPKPTATPSSPLSGKVYAVTTSVPAYKSASTSSKCIGHLYYGQSITCVAVSGNWAKVRSSSGVTAYCKISGISNVNPNTLSQKVYINTNNAPVYKIPSTSSAVWGRLKKDSSFTAVAVTPDGAWTRLKKGSLYAYIPSKYVSDSAAIPAPTATPAPTPTPTPSITGKVYVTATTVIVYKTASTSAKAVAASSYGESMTIVKSSGKWAQVRTFSGVTGYCALDSLSATNPNTYSQTIYINTNNAPVYKAASTSTAVWARLEKNTSFTAVAITPDGKWFRIKNGSYYAYILSKYITTTKPDENQGTEQTVYSIVTSLPVYASASTSAESKGHIYLGQSVTLIGASDGWSKVRNSAGMVGYCSSSGLSSEDPNTLNMPYYAKSKTVKLYEKPSKSATVSSTVSQNTSLMAVCLSEDGVWARIALSNGSFAYALASDLSATRIDDDVVFADITPVTVYTIPTSLTIYTSPSTSSQSMGTIYFGQSITCTGKSSSWARVRNDAGKTGYCDLSSLTTTNPNAYSTPIYAQVDGAKIYEQPVTGSKVLATIPLNGQITGVAYNSDRTWYRVKNGSTYGYVQTSYFATSKVSEAVSQTAAKVVTFAKQFLGVPYLYGGQSPSAFDCSGFTYYVFKNAAGISLKRTAYSQGYDNTYQKITKRADLKVGDILFFDTVPTDSDLCDHAGIYLGSNQFIHASSGGGKVMISSLGSSTKDYYYRTFSWARRILK